MGLRYAPRGYTQIALLTTAHNIFEGMPDGVVPADADYAEIKVSGQAVRWRDDGTDPTTSVGIPQAVNDVVEYTGDLSAIRFIGAVTGAVLDVSFYKIAG